MIRSNSDSPPSQAPSVLSELTADQQEQLAELLDRYLQALESGAPLDVDQLAEAHPDLADAFRQYLSRLEDLYQASAAFAEQRTDSGTKPADEKLTDSRRLGDFILGDEIGRGGMGVVYEARQISLDRKVALKVLPFSAVLDSRQIARFRNEAKAAAQLQHPHIVPVYAVGSERGVHYYAMQLIEGRPLDTIVAQLRSQRKASPGGSNPDSTNQRAQSSTLDKITSGSLTPVDYYRTVARLGREAAAALDAAHQEGVVHRDIKPSNLLIDQDGKLWITDFGLARMHREAALSRSGDIVGTWRYMSPEQARGESALIDHRTDVYSLGVTLWELLALEPLYSGEDRATVLRQLDQDSPPRLLPRCPGLPRDLETVVLKAMARRREDRYESAAALALDLGRVLEGKPTQARPPSWSDRVVRVARRYQRAMAVAMVFVVLLASVSSAAAFLTLHARWRAEVYSQRADRNYRAARGVLDRLGAHYADRMQALAGAETLRHELLQETLGYYQQFVRDAGDDPQLHADIAQTFRKIGSLAAELGSHAEALDANRQALSRFEQLLSDHPRSPELRREKAIVHRQLAESLRWAGNLAEARQTGSEAIRLLDELVRVERSDNLDLSSELASAMEELARIDAAANDLQAARIRLTDAIGIERGLHDKRPDVVDVSRRLAAALNQLGQLFVDHRPAESRNLHQEAVTILGQHVSGPTTNPRLVRELAATFDHLGAAEFRLKNWADAIAAYRQALTLRERLEGTGSEPTALQSELAATSNNLGLALVRAGQFAEAAESFERAIRRQQHLVTSDPRDVPLRSDLGNMWNNLAIAQERLEQLELAASSFERAIADQRLALERSRKVDYYRGLLIKHYAGYSRVLTGLGRAEEAARVDQLRQQLGKDADRTRDTD